jgi:hypothetical protein
MEYRIFYIATMPAFFFFALALALSVFAKDWVHYTGQNEVRDAARTDNGTLWAIFAWGLAERLPNKNENIYMPGNNNLQAADFVQIFALPGDDIIAVSKNGTLVRKNKNFPNFETINTSFVERKRNVMQGLGKRAENILVLPLEGAIAFFDYEQNRSAITLSQIGTNSLDEIKRIAIKDDSIWVDLGVNVWKRIIDWDNIYNDRFLADPSSWNKVNEIPFPEEPKPLYNANGFNFYLRNANTVSLISDGKVVAWGNDYQDFSVMQNEQWSGIFKANQNPNNYGDDQKNYSTKSLAALPNGKFAFGLWGPGIITYNENYQATGWFHSLSSADKCPTKFRDGSIDGWTIVQGIVPSPNFSGYVFSYFSQDNYGLGFLNGDSPQCIKSKETSSDAAFSVAVRENDASEWDIYVAWQNDIHSKAAGGIDFYKTSSKNFSPSFQKKWVSPSGAPIDFAFDSRGVLWTVSQSKIFYLDEQNGEWKEPSYIRGYSGSTILTLETDAQNGLWIGTRNDGAYLFSQKNNSPDSLVAKNFKIKDGLLNETINDIAIDAVKGKVYFAHDLGLSVYSTALVRNTSDYMQSGAPKVIAYPNPFRPNQHSFVTIDFVNEKSSVYILDSSGKRVRLFRENDLRGGRVVWDGKNESGKLVAPGLYHYIAADGKNTTKGKIIIER